MTAMTNTCFTCGSCWEALLTYNTECIFKGQVSVKGSYSSFDFGIIKVQRDWLRRIVADMLLATLTLNLLFWRPCSTSLPSYLSTSFLFFSRHGVTCSSVRRPMSCKSTYGCIKIIFFLKLHWPSLFDHQLLALFFVYRVRFFFLTFHFYPSPSTCSFHYCA